MVPEPFFMKNKEWYYYDEEEHILRLTDKATRKAQKSYEKFYKEVASFHDLPKDKEKFK